MILRTLKQVQHAVIAIGDKRHIRRPTDNTALEHRLMYFLLLDLAHQKGTPNYQRAKINMALRHIEPPKEDNDEGTQSFRFACDCVHCRGRATAILSNLQPR